ncbi:C-C motif chemokine 25 [Myripristis murdjan]|uniref:C-C motif chemokine 25 n=1 Tax=Myripristis murdjan TaxID=586833 RepID=UPI0011760646|nr:C-C motif chemokine 25-like [Myripristis murdjan]
MRCNLLFFLLLLACLCLTLAQGSYEDCCLKYVKGLSKGVSRMAVKYRWQETDGGCNIAAVVFTMRRGRVFCGDPAQQWVRDLMKNIDKKHTRKTIHRRRPKKV